MHVTKGAKSVIKSIWSWDKKWLCEQFTSTITTKDMKQMKHSYTKIKQKQKHFVVCNFFAYIYMFYDAGYMP